MVKQLFNMEEIDSEIGKHGVEKSITLTLNENDIKIWKEKGYFKHIRNELSIIPNIQFACVKHGYGYCSYHFICDTDEIANRLKRMLKSMHNDNNVRPLMKCSNKILIAPERTISSGNVEACTLFS